MRPLRICRVARRCASPNCATTTSCWKPRATSPPAVPDGARDWKCCRNSAIPFSTLCWRCSSPSKAATRMGMRSNWNRPWNNWPWTFAPAFTIVAECIHKWRFHIPPPGMNLEQDIADLEARMDAVRHTGIRLFAGRNSARLRRAAPLEADCAAAARLACLRPAAPSARRRSSAKLPADRQTASSSV